MKKCVLATFMVLICMLWCIPVQAADLPQRVPQTVIVKHYESNGTVIVSEDTIFTVMPDGRLVSKNKQEIPAPYTYALYSALATITRNGSVARCTGALDIKRSDCTISGKLRICRSTDETSWTTKKSKSYSTSKKEVFVTDFEYAMGYGYYYRAEMDINTTNSAGVLVESLTVASGTIEN